MISLNGKEYRCQIMEPTSRQDGEWFVTFTEHTGRKMSVSGRLLFKVQILLEGILHMDDVPILVAKSKKGKKLFVLTGWTCKAFLTEMEKYPDTLQKFELLAENRVAVTETVLIYYAKQIRETPGQSLEVLNRHGKPLFDLPNTDMSSLIKIMDEVWNGKPIPISDREFELVAMKFP